MVHISTLKYLIKLSPTDTETLGLGSKGADWFLGLCANIKAAMLLCALQCLNGNLEVTEYIYNIQCFGGVGQGLKGEQQQICSLGAHSRLIQPC